MFTKTTGTTKDQQATTHQTQVHRETGSGKAKVGHFVRHFLEMCAAMCLGMAVLTPVYVWAAGMLGYGEPFLQFPELSALVAAFNMTAPMAAWMRFRRMDWRSNAEMSAAMLVEAVLIVGAYWLGILPKSDLFGWQHGMMMPAMLIPMFLRLDIYTGKACHRGR